MEKNRRQSERISLLLEVELELSSGKRECRISDLSTGGCFVDSIAAVTKGEIINLMLPLSTGQWLHLSGEVIHIFPNIGFGLRFINLDHNGQTLLRQFVREHGGNPSIQPFIATEQETETVEKTESKDETSQNSEIKQSDEFKQFIEDLFDEIDERKTP